MSRKGPLKKGFWNVKKNVIEDAKKYAHRSVWNKKSRGAWSAAVRNGWYKEATKHMDKSWRAIAWTEDRIFKTMDGYEYYSDWHKGEMSAYAVAQKRGLLPKCRKKLKLGGPPRKRLYPDDLIVKSANLYQHKTDWLKANPGAVNAARSRGIYKNVTAHMTRKPQSVTWSRKKVSDAIKSCKTIREVIEKFPGVYAKAHKSGWWPKMSKHLRREGSRFWKYIYAFEFVDKTVYVGQAYDQQKRYIQHLEGNGVVGKKAKKFKFKFVEGKKLIPRNKAVEAEQSKMDRYRKNGWKLLNRVRAGSLGGAVIKWTKASVLREARRFKTNKSWIAKGYGSYQAASKLRILKKCQAHMIPPKNKSQGYWNVKKNVTRSALGYDRIIDWKRAEPAAYRAARVNGWHKIATAHMKGSGRAPHGSWQVRGNVMRSAKKYKSRAAWKHAEVGAYVAARKNGWLKAATSHMKSVKHPQGYWKKKSNVFEAAKNFKSITEFEDKHSGAVLSARKNGWGEELKKWFKTRQNR